MRISDCSSDVCSSDLGDDERAEILRKLEESRLRNLTEQQRLAEEDKRRVEAAAERKRKEEEEAERLRVEAEMDPAACSLSPADEPAPRQPHGQWHTRSEAARRENEGVLTCNIPWWPSHKQNT